MYFTPQRIWVRPLVRQSAPSDAILLPGRACGMPQAEPRGLVASVRQPLSCSHSGSKHWNCSSPTRDSAYALYVPRETDTCSFLNVRGFGAGFERGMILTT